MEYIVKGPPHRDLVKEVLDGALTRAVEAYVTPITVSETLYVASRIYELAGAERPNEEALNFVEWLTARVRVAEATDVAIEAGEIRKELRIPLPDCYVIAAAVKLKARALFLRPEREVLDRMEVLRRLPIASLTEVVPRRGAEGSDSTQH